MKNWIEKQKMIEKSYIKDGKWSRDWKGKKNNVKKYLKNTILEQLIIERWLKHYRLDV